jgi:hypothetical protein
LTCDNNGSPVCGCDGVTYWNDCLRAQTGIVSSTPGQCPLDTSAGCDAGPSCPITGASCVRLLVGGPPPNAPPGGMCHDDPGFCWLLPASCPNDPNDRTWALCGSNHVCETTCDAMRSQAPHFLVHGPPGCQQ